MKRKLCFGLLLVMICTCVFTGCNTMDTPISSGTPTTDTQSTGTSSPASSTVGSVSESTSSQTSSVTSAAGKTSTTSQTQKPTVSTRATTTTSKPTTTTSAPVVLGKSENNVEFIGCFATVGGTDYKKFEWSGSTITAGFEGTEISIVLKILRNGPYGENDYFNVTVDNAASPWDTVNAIDSITHFLKGNTAFLLYESWVLNQQIKPRANFDYGMLPYPKGPNASGYVSNSMNARVMCLTSTNKNADKTAIIFNALARPVDDQLDWTADVQADYFQKNDTQSIKMYDLCLRNVTFDPAYAVNEVANELNFVFASTIFGRTTTPAAGLGAIGNKLDASIDALFNKK